MRESCCGRKLSSEKMIACCNDGTRPLIFKIERIGIPETEARAFFERFMFQVLNYEGPTFTDGKKRVTGIYTMNAPDEYMDGCIGNTHSFMECNNRP